MAIVFNCPNCKQQLEAENSMSGSTIACPSCNQDMLIPGEEPAAASAPAALISSESAKKEHRFAVPTYDKPAEALIEKPRPPLEVAAKDGDKKMRVKCIRRTDCVEVGKDHFDEVVSEFLCKIGETNLISITPIAYTHLDLGSRQLMTDFGVMIVYKG